MNMKVFISIYVVILLSLSGVSGYYFYLYRIRVNMEIVLLREHNRLLELKVVTLQQQPPKVNTFDCFTTGDMVIVCIGVLIVGLCIVAALQAYSVQIQYDQKVTKIIEDFSFVSPDKAINVKLDHFATGVTKSVDLESDKLNEILCSYADNCCRVQEYHIIDKINIEGLTLCTQRVILNNSSYSNLDIYLDLIKNLNALEATPSNYRIVLDIIGILSEKGI